MIADELTQTLMRHVYQESPQDSRGKSQEEKNASAVGFLLNQIEFRSVLAGKEACARKGEANVFKIGKKGLALIVTDTDDGNYEITFRQYEHNKKPHPRNHLAAITFVAKLEDEKLSLVQIKEYLGTIRDLREIFSRIRAAGLPQKFQAIDSSESYWGMAGNQDSPERRYWNQVQRASSMEFST